MKPSSRRPFVVVIDPAVHSPEIACFNRLADLSSLPLKYHLPALGGVGTLPSSPEEVAAIAGLVCLGSGASVHDGHAWQKQMNPWLLALLEKSIPTLAICYGHQLLAHLFGGRVGYVSADHRKHVGFRHVKLARSTLWGPHEGPLFVYHCEEVKEAPADFEVIASSEAIAIEAMAHRRLPIWSFQPHPEAGPSFAAERTGSNPTPEVFTFGNSLVKAFLDAVAQKVGAR